MLDSKKDTIIKCPYCGWEYLPAEIFYPQYILGKPKDIEKTVNGIIVDYYGHSPELEETYKCDNCLNVFKTKIGLSFMVDRAYESDELEDFAQPLYTNRLVLKED